MVSLCLLEANYDPTIQIGAILNEINGNYRVGNSDYFILEACEYVESFLKFSPKSAIVLNIDSDHLDYFEDFAHINLAFQKYVDILPKDGILVVNADDENCLKLRDYTSAKTVTCGIKNKRANFVASNISFDENGFPKFDVYHNNNYYGEFKLSVVGLHNVLNSLTCIALCHEHGVSKYDIKGGLLKFKGANRRFELIGESRGAFVYDDYAHHPSEVIATVEAMKNKTYRQSWAVFQPHTYSRTHEFLEDFAKSLLDFDNIIITDIYAARETNTYGISSEDLVNKIKSLGKEAILISDFDDICHHIKERACPKDIIMTIGAGTVDEVARKIID